MIALFTGHANNAQLPSPTARKHISPDIFFCEIVFAPQMASSISIQSLLLSSKVQNPLSFQTPTPKLFLDNNCSNGSYKIHRRVKRKFSGKWRTMVQQTVQGPPAAYAKEMERLSAKESLLLAFKDAGGFQALVSGKATELQRIDVNERIVILERLNPTPRPATSPYLEGRWNFEWFGSGSIGLFAARFLFEWFPPELANLSKMDVVIKDGYVRVAANVKLLNSIESNVIVSTKLSVEGPLRMKEEYVEGLLQSPKVIEESIPEQLKAAFGQAATTLEQLPVPIKDAVSSGLKFPLGGRFERLFLMSYLDDEILIIRDSAGVPEVLTRLDPGPSIGPIPKYES